MKLINYVAFGIILVGVFSFINETVAIYVLYLIGLPMVLPIFLMVIGSLIYFSTQRCSNGVYIDGYENTPFEIEQKTANVLKERGYDVRKKM